MLVKNSMLLSLIPSLYEVINGNLKKNFYWQSLRFHESPSIRMLINCVILKFALALILIKTPGFVKASYILPRGAT